MKITIAILFVLFCSTTLFAQEQTNDLEKKIQNPIASLISIPLQNNSDFGLTLYDPLVQEYFTGTRNTLNVQPVLPLGLGKKVTLIARTIIPFISLPLNTDKTQSGLGDINMSLYLTPAKPGKFIYGIGLALGLPTAMYADVLGSEKWSAGPGFVALVQPGSWTFGGLLQNTWSYAGNKDREDVNLLYSQLFITKNLKKGWYINSAPIITADWEAESGNQWTIPIGIGMGKLFKVGKLPMNGQMGYYSYVVSPEGGPDSQLRIQLAFLFPK